MSKELVDAIANMDEQQALQLTREMLARGGNPLDILDSSREAVAIVGQRYEAGDYFLSELLMAGDMLNRIGEMVKPRLATGIETKFGGKVVVGTVEGDVHDIGKNIVAFMLDAHGFEVHDLGVDVPPSKFVEAIQRVQPDVVGLSALLSVAFESMKTTIQVIKAAGLRDEVKIMIGGSQTNDTIRAYVGADAYGSDAIEAVKLAEAWTRR